ncbi:MAG: hypothetical protein GEU83_05310 [Pseudonocardiaceae bacterium]|nr:hypothetical protein [Pseudonocardiaceae bacterium]
MIVRVAVVPHPPILVPEVAAGAAGEIAVLREACLVAARALASDCRHWVAVGAGDPAATGTAGTMRGYGADVVVALTPDSAPPRDDLPLSMLVASWLRAQVDDPGLVVSPAPVPPGTTPADCARIGRELAAGLAGTAEPVGLLVLGDGAATHTVRAPGYFDPRAGGFDARIAAALASPDLGALLAVDAGLSDELGVAGREAWQVGAAVAQASASRWRGKLLHSAAPYGVAYHVALWEAALGEAAR